MLLLLMLLLLLLLLLWLSLLLLLLLLLLFLLLALGPDRWAPDLRKVWERKFNFDIVSGGGIVYGVLNMIFECKTKQKRNIICLPTFR